MSRGHKKSREVVLGFLLLIGLTTACGVPEGQQNTDDQLQTPLIQRTSTAATEIIANVAIEEQTYSTTSDEPRYHLDAAWINLSGPEEFINPFNEKVNNLVEETQERFLDSVRERHNQDETDGEAPLSTLDIGYDVTYHKQGLISVYFEFTEYIAVSAHPASYSYSINYNILNASFLSFDDLFLDTADPMGSLVDFTAKEINQRGFETQPELIEEILREKPNWSLYGQGLRINFDAYQVAPGAAGPQFVLIPWGELVSSLDTNGPSGVILED